MNKEIPVLLKDIRFIFFRYKNLFDFDKYFFNPNSSIEDNIEMAKFYICKVENLPESDDKSLLGEPLSEFEKSKMDAEALLLFDLPK